LLDYNYNDYSIPVTAIPTVFISLDVFTLSVFGIEYALAETDNPVIVFVVDAAAPTGVFIFVSTNSSEMVVLNNQMAP
jgi:hypothetical protein